MYSQEPTMKIVLFEIEAWERNAFSELEDRGYEIVFDKRALDADTVADHGDAAIISTFIYSKLNAEVLAKFENLKFIATRSTGFDHIDLDYCQEHDITVANVPSYGENTVAEHVFALLLSISHRVVDGVDRTRRGDFSPRGLQGFDLKHKTLGIIGTGHIGFHVAHIAKGFMMNVVAFDIKPDEQAAQEIGFDYVDMDTLLKQADVISIHVPGSEKTKHLLGKEQFDAMKQGVVLINTARGPIIDIQALLQALTTGKVAAAGLDVLPEEPVIREEAELLRSLHDPERNLETLLADHVLLRLRNVIITPHSAFNTREAVQRILDTTCDNIVAFTDEQPKNIVSK
jgi:D-lactate dehydrogenase